MPDCYLLYIDILGFSELVLKKGRIEDLYDQIDTLNSHEHTAFKTLAFSDTILIYNTVEWGRHYLVMYLCEFAQDLFYRLVSRDLHFRAYLCKGEFNHQRREHIHRFTAKRLFAPTSGSARFNAAGCLLKTIFCRTATFSIPSPTIRNAISSTLCSRWILFIFPMSPIQFPRV